MSDEQKPRERARPGEREVAYESEACHRPSEADSTGYRFDSRRYQAERDHVEADSTGYQAERDHGDRSSTGARRPADHDQPEPEPYSFGEARRRRLRHFDEGRVLDPRGGWLPDRATMGAAYGTDGLRPHVRSRQVNFRLDHVRYGQLLRAARLYGTTPAGLARMLVNRGVQSVLAPYRAEMVDPAHDDRDDSDADQEDW